MRRFPLFAIVLLATPAAAQTPPVTLEATISGQPIRAPAGDLRVTIGETTLPPGGRIAAHKHLHPRLVKVLAGEVSGRNLDTGKTFQAKAGDWLIDPIDQWHEAEVVGDEPARLMTIDYAPPGAQVTIPRKP